MIINSREIGERVRWVRKSKGLSQKDFGERLKVSDQTISRIERGNQLPSIDLLIDLNSQFDVSPRWIVFNDQDDNIAVLLDFLEGTLFSEQYINLFERISSLFSKSEDEVIDSVSGRIKHFTDERIFAVAQTMNVSLSTAKRIFDSSRNPVIDHVINYCAERHYIFDYVVLGQIMYKHNILWRVISDFSYEKQEMLICIYSEFIRFLKE